MFLVLLTVLTVNTVIAEQPQRANLMIVGGESTNITDHPWQVSFQYRYQHFCSGFLISSRWVVTAAHCLTEGYTKNINIRAGSALSNSGGQTSSVSSYIIHPDFADDETYDNDIALLYLATAITTSTASAATLPESGEEVADNVTVILSGWGLTSESGSVSTQLLEVEVPTVNSETCRTIYSSINNVTDNMFCAGLLGTGGKDTCTGDSGGPVELDGTIIGIVSWGTGCARAEYPGVYTKVSNYIDWITENTGI
ncbi:trypsin-like [Diorhabda sublineata]|uniref:trypsin-like n=1 Tax=Diorhabda sublineata TaxID=1163346 RepID=UPI0024E11FB3|nr:trypsin-like [Diorhabda sublineata]